jgi:hypothetical protein
MTCTRYPDDDVVVRYVTSELAEPELSTFEDHMFACDACFARVERYQGAQDALAVRELPAVTIAVPAASGQGRAGIRQLPWWMLGAMAAGLVTVLGALTFWAWRPDTPVMLASTTQAPAAAAEPTSPPAPVTIPAGSRSTDALRVAVLAMVTPPPYLPLTTRGDSPSDDEFRAGMGAYTRNDWSAASRSLREVSSPQASFYRGVADLMRGEPVEAATALDAARASGRLPYARESLFYLGKAALQRGDVAAARELFVAARDAGAGPGGEAARLVRALDELQK